MQVINGNLNKKFSLSIVMSPGKFPNQRKVWGKKYKIRPAVNISKPIKIKSFAILF